MEGQHELGGQISPEVSEGSPEQKTKREMEELVKRTRRAIPFAIAEARMRLASPGFYRNAMHYAEERLKEAREAGDVARIKEKESSLLGAKQFPEEDRRTIEFLQDILDGNLPDNWLAKPDWHYYPFEGIYRHNVVRISSTLENAKEETKYVNGRVRVREKSREEEENYLKGMVKYYAVEDVPQPVFEEIFNDALTQYRALEEKQEKEET